MQRTYYAPLGKQMSEERDWNAYFAEQMAARERERAEKLRKAKAAAANTSKEPFDAKKFREIYTRLDTYGVDQYTPWDTLIEESEYEYYVNHTDILKLEELVKHLLWQDGFA
jgi:hypothetical protein